MIKMRKTHLALLVTLLLVDVTLQSDKMKRQSNPCPENWHYVSSLRKCYGFLRPHVSWINAVGICHAFGAKLIAPKREDEMDAIVLLMRSINTGAVWTGGNTIDTHQTWQWFDEHTPIGEYTPWDSNNPDDYQYNEHCLEIQPEYGYKWNDIDCNVNNTVGCELSRSGYNGIEWT